MREFERPRQYLGFEVVGEVVSVGGPEPSAERQRRPGELEDGVDLRLHDRRGRPGRHTGDEEVDLDGREAVQHGLERPLIFAGVERSRPGRGQLQRFPEQFRLADERVERAGVEDRLEVGPQVLLGRADGSRARCFSVPSGPEK